VKDKLTQLPSGTWVDLTTVTVIHVQEFPPGVFYIEVDRGTRENPSWLRAGSGLTEDEAIKVRDELAQAVNEAGSD